MLDWTTGAIDSGAATTVGLGGALGIRKDVADVAHLCTGQGEDSLDRNAELFLKSQDLGKSKK
jgi:hypothetical protein